MQPDRERAKAAYKDRDYELLLNIALQTIDDREQLQKRLDHAQAVMEDALAQLEAWHEKRPPTGSPHRRA